MPFKVKKPTGISGKDLPGLKENVIDLARWAEDEFNEVANALQGTEASPIWHKPPPKPRTGTMVYADGTNWNPGSGEGFYFYKSTGVWVPMF